MTLESTARADRDAKLNALNQRLADAVGDLVTGEDWKRALVFAARFRSRSFNNTLLIAVQHRAAFEEHRVPEPTPTYVAGYRQWLTVGRHVMKGQSGYQILAPVTARLATTTPEEPLSWRRLGRGQRPQPGVSVRSQLIGVRVAHVWDVSQTDGDPLPQRPVPLLLRGHAPAGLWDGLADQISARGFGLRLVSTAAAIGGANGLTDYLTREVSIRMDMEEAAQVKTLAHELGHVLLHGPDLGDAAEHRGLAEVEAESVALMVGATHGLDTASYTIPYVASWAGHVPGMTPVEVVHATADRVRATALRRLVVKMALSRKVLKAATACSPSTSRLATSSGIGISATRVQAVIALTLASISCPFELATVFVRRR